jgi:hypothetical protein
MNCTNCGYPVDAATAATCPRCGRPLQISAPPLPDTQPPFALPALSFAPLPPSSPPPVHPPRSRARLFIGLALAVIVVAAGAGGAYLASRNNQSSGSTANTALATATATDVPAVTPSPTTMPSPTATKPPAPKPTPVPQLVTLFYDPLTSNKYGWPTDSSACYFQSGGYHVINGAECEAPLKQQSNVNISVMVKQIAGSTGISYGIGFRVVSLDQNQYFFFINGLGNWLVFGSSGALVPPRSTSAIHRGLNATNTLEVDCSGSHFTFYINGVNVGSVSNGSISSGEMAVGMEPDQSAVGTQVVFTNFTVTQWQ